MPPPTWIPGQVLAASDVNSWMVPLAVVKLADQSRASSTTITSDSELFVPVVASATYWFHCYILYEGATGPSAGGMQWQWTVPASAGLRYHAIHEGLGGSANTVQSGTAVTIISTDSNGAGTLCGTTMLGTLVTAGSGGNIQFQWAQAVTNATPTIVHAQSAIMLQRVS